jgi:hypothetical protein
MHEQMHQFGMRWKNLMTDRAGVKTGIGLKVAGLVQSGLHTVSIMGIVNIDFYLHILLVLCSAAASINDKQFRTGTG